MFGYQFSIYFKGNERAYPTKNGGFLSLLVNMVIIWQSYTHFDDMITFNNDDIQINTIETDFESLGNVTMKEIGGSLPFYALRYKFSFLKTVDQEVCGGSCFDMLNEHTYMHWDTFTMFSYTEFKEVKYPVRVCDKEDIGAQLYD